MRSIFYGTFWFMVYLFLSAAPVLVLLIGDAPPGRGFLREFSVGLGFIGLSMMGWQFLLTGRFKRITSPYGIDVVYHFHRLVSIIAFTFIFLHIFILVIISTDTLVFLNPLNSPWWMVTGLGGFLCFMVIILTSLYRLKLRLNYESWRIIHGVISVLAVLLAVIHVVGVRYYLEHPLKLWLWIFMAAVWILALLYVRILKPLLLLKRPFRVEQVIKERGNSWSLVFKPDGHDGLKFSPGQFGWLFIGKSPFAIREHPFSFSSSAMKPDRIEMAIKELGDFTSKIGDVKPGTRAYIDGPYGTFTIDKEKSPGYVFLAGGVGISPVMSMLRTMRDRVDRRPVILFYGSKNWEGVTFREEIETFKNELNLKVVHVLEEATDDWDGERGFITTEIMARHLPEKRLDYEYFVCGPQPMQLAVKNALNEIGVSLTMVESESFNFV